MSLCACRYGQAMCLWHFGRLSNKRRQNVRRRMGLRK